jgi:hypothetical protein
MKRMKQTIYEGIPWMLKRDVKLSSFLWFFYYKIVVYLASHVGRNYSVKFLHCVDWGRMAFYHELSFFLKLCILVVPWILEEGM